MTSKTTITLNGTTFTVEATEFATLEDAKASGLFFDDTTGIWYEPTAEIVAYRRARHTEAGSSFLAASQRRYSDETDRMDARLAEVAGV